MLGGEPLLYVKNRTKNVSFLYEDTALLLKVSKSQNKFMMSSFLPKYEQNIWRISALASKKWLNQKHYITNELC